jgi:hypothetical protein
LTKKFARRIVISGAVIIVVRHRYLQDTGAARQAPLLRERAPEFQEMKMRKTILTVLGSALMAVSIMQTASAAEHRSHKADRAAVSRTEQFRNSNAYAAPVQPEWPGYGYSDGYYSHGFSAPAGR